MRDPDTLDAMKAESVVASIVVLALLSACGGGGGGNGAARDRTSSGADEFQESYAGAKAYPVFVSSEIVVGENRFLVGLLDDNDAPIGNPNIDVSVRFYDLSGAEPEPAEEMALDYLPLRPGNRALYVGHPTFDHAGRWGAEVTITGDGIDETLKGSFTVAETSTTPAIGAAAPATDNPTAADVDDLSSISTDPKPDPSFYEETVAQALKDGDPFVLTFATPKYCQTAACGPALDIVKAVSKDHPEVTFIHVEPYENLDEIGNTVEAVDEWGLPTEPFIFVVDASGKVAAKFEGVVSAPELRASLDDL